jgi:hypothetical protein
LAGAVTVVEVITSFAGSSLRNHRVVEMESRLFQVSRIET